MMKRARWLAVTPYLALLAIGVAAIAGSGSSDVIRIDNSANAALTVRLPDGSAAVQALEVDNIVPGTTVTQPLRLTADEKSFALTLGASSIRNAENGCTSDEALVDHTCGSDQGELSSTLQVSVIAARVYESLPCDYSDAEPQHLGTLDDLAVHAAAIDLDVPKNWVACVELQVTLPTAAGNETQSDGVTFDLAWTATEISSTPGFVVIPQQGGNARFDATPGQQVHAGYDFTYVAGSSVRIDGGYGVLSVGCKDGTAPTRASVSVPMPNTTYSAPEPSSQGWTPSGDEKADSVYQGSLTLGDYCHGGVMVIGNTMGPLAANVISSTAPSLNFRWHYGSDAVASGGGSGWSATKSVTPSLLAP